MNATMYPGLVLKITPPKLRRSLLVRERLRQVRTSQEDVSVFLVEAPAGHGKTSLLAQWRLDWMQDGAVVAWLSLDSADSPVTVVSGVVEGLRRSTGRAPFGTESIEAVRRGSGAVPALTSLLAEITEAATPTVLVFDNFERVRGEAVLEVFDYLVHNLPPNLRLVFGSRPPAPLGAVNLLGSGMLRRITPDELRFDLAETIRLLSGRLGDRVDADACARLHETTQGWPLGLQIAATALEGATDPSAAVERFAALRDDTTRHLFDSMLDAMPVVLTGFVTRCALLDALHPSLCEAVTDEDRAGLYLQQLLVETPLLSATEDGDWVRFHPLAREYLRARAERCVAEADRREIHLRAWRWLAARGFAERAAHHALAAGCHREAVAMIAGALNDEFERGHDGTVLEWLSRLAPQEIGHNTQLRLLTLWMTALRYHPDEAVRQARALIDDAGVDEVVRGEAVLAQYVARTFQEPPQDPETLESIFAVASMDLRGARVYANLKSGLAVYRGATELARREQARVPDDGRFPVVRLYADYFVGLSYLWEGRPVLAEQAVRLQHARWEGSVGRRGQWTTMLGTLLAAACWQRDLREEARTLLADRLDVIEQGTAPDGIIYAYRTLARIALAAGDEVRGLAYLEALEAVGETRGLIRLSVSGLAERIRVHAARQRPGQAAALLPTLALHIERSSETDLLATLYRLDLRLASACVDLVTDDLEGAGVRLAQAMELAKQLNRGYEIVQVLALQALLAARSGGPSVRLIREAVSRAESGGLVRVFADTVPEVVELVREHAEAGVLPPSSRGFIDRVLAAANVASFAAPPATTAPASAILTPKEQAVLEQLASGLSNKRIATELGLSSETVKWHVKKLFAKLNAGTREHAVARARMLGLLR
jgi:LuxR family transcriptional regulator, maltose regulon positive regulatory protein